MILCQVNHQLHIKNIKTQMNRNNLNRNKKNNYRIHSTKETNRLDFITKQIISQPMEVFHCLQVFQALRILSRANSFKNFFKKRHKYKKIKRIKNKNSKEIFHPKIRKKSSSNLEEVTARKMIHLHFKKVALWAAVHQILLIRLDNHQNLRTFYILLRILVKIKSNNLKSLKKANFKKTQQIKISRKLIQTKIEIKISIRIIK